MARDSSDGKILPLYFRSTREKNAWMQAAEESGEKASRYILDMAELGRAKRAASPRGPEVPKLREEVIRLKNKLADLEMVREAQETEILKLRKRAFLQPGFRGDREYSKPLLDLLRTGGTWSAKEILRALHISHSDTEAVEIIVSQLRGLAGYGVLEEDAQGWRWVE